MAGETRVRPAAPVPRPPALPRGTAECGVYSISSGCCRPADRRTACASSRQVRRDRRGVECRRHHHQLEIGPPRALQPAQQRQRQIAFQMALVEFVEHHAGHALERRVAQQAAREHAFGQKAQARPRARPLLRSGPDSRRSRRRARRVRRPRSAPPDARPAGAVPAPVLRADPVPAGPAGRAWSSPRRAALPAPECWRCAGDAGCRGVSSSMGRRTRASIVASQQCSGVLCRLRVIGVMRQKLFQHEGGLALFAAPQMDLGEVTAGDARSAPDRASARVPDT